MGKSTAKFKKKTAPKTTRRARRTSAAAAPRSAGDWLVLRATYLKGTARHAPALFYAADELIRENRSADAARLAEQFRASIADARAPNEHVRRTLLARYLDERLGNVPTARAAADASRADDRREAALAANGFPHQVTKYGGLEARVSAELWTALAPVMRFMKNRELDRLQAAVDTAVAALPRKPPNNDSFDDRATAWAAGHVLVAAGLSKNSTAVASVNPFYAKAIGPPFHLASRLGLGEAADARKVAMAAARAAAKVLADPDDRERQSQMPDVVGPCVQVAVAMGDAGLARAILKPATEAAHEAKGAYGPIKAAIHAALAAFWAQAGDGAAADREVKEANAVAKKIKDRRFAEPVWTMIVNACAKLKRRDEAIETAGRIGSRDTKAFVLATLFTEFCDPVAALDVIKRQPKADTRAALCGACAANFHEADLFTVLAPPE